MDSAGESPGFLEEAVKLPSVGLSGTVDLICQLLGGRKRNGSDCYGKRSWLTWSLVVLLVMALAGAAAAEEKAVQYVTLEEAEQIAMENSVKLSWQSSPWKRPSFSISRREAAMIMRPSPVVLMQAQAGLDIAQQQYLTALDELLWK